MELNFKKSKGDESEKLYEMFNITRSRKTELGDAIYKTIAGYVGGKNKVTFFPIATMVKDIAAFCVSIEEVSYVSFVLGEVLEKARKPNTPFGDLGAILGGIIQIKMSKHGDNGDTFSTGDEDPIAKLIRESEKINGKYGERDQGE